MNNRQKITVSFFGATDTGMVRTNNEDNFIACEIWGGSHLLLAAIDGIGGYEGGEVAAQIARDVITEVVSSNPDNDCLDLLKDAVTEANNAIVEHKRADAERSRMGCVISSAIISLNEARVYMVHVGDSRLYQFTASEGLRKLSHDHSLVGYREEIGMLTEEQAMHHPQRNIIERSLGDALHESNDVNFLDAGIFPILGPTQYLLCSDGLSDMLYSAEIASVLATDSSAQDEAMTLIRRANEAGGKDNVTAVIAKIEMPQRQSEQPAHTANEAGNETAFPTPLPPADNSDDLIADSHDEVRIPEAVPVAAAKKQKMTMKRFNIYVISIALSFIIGGTTGYFIGYFTANDDSVKATENLADSQDSVVTAINNPTDTIADPRRVGEETADSLNRRYSTTKDSTKSTSSTGIER